MQIYQIFIPELATSVKFKVLPTSEVEQFISKHKKKNQEDLKKLIIENFVYNLKTDVASSLAMMSRDAGNKAIEAIYTGCVMLNPGLNLEFWIDTAFSGLPVGIFDQDEEDNNFDFEKIKDYIHKQKNSKKTTVNKTFKKLTKQKFLGLDEYLKSCVIGQDEAVEEVVSALYRCQADLHDNNRPLGVFLFAGSSGVGKTHLANKLHNYMYGLETNMVRIDCGEFQHKHENQKLLGAPPGYVGHDEGGQLTNQVKKNPNTVILLDEVEKAHEDMWNTFLRVFDEGFVTDNKGEVVDFRNSIIIMTTNLGNDKVVENLISTGVGFGQSVDFDRKTEKIPIRNIVEKNTMKAIDKYFRPEFLNRIDKVVIFNHLEREDCVKIAQLEMSVTAEKLSKKGISLEYTDNVINGLIDLGIDTIKGARGIAQIRRDNIETKIAQTIVKSSIPRGTIFHIDYLERNFVFDIQKPVKKSKTNKIEELGE
jgi:ATP-dependent Clp protease ATP-binding subunit ClpA